MSSKRESQSEYEGIHDIEKDLSFERKELKVQKVYWVLVTLFVAGGFLGLFGKGIVSNARVEGTGYHLQYDRFLRDETPTEISISLEKEMSSPVTVEISKQYMDLVKLQGVVPQPESVSTKNNKFIFTFNSSGGGLIIFDLVPQSTGTLYLDIFVQNEGNRLNQFVYF